MNYQEELPLFQPLNEQEIQDKKVTLAYMREFPHNLLTRENEFAHFTASSMIFDETKTKVLMAYHNIYKSWSWTGGHADGETDFLKLAIREAKEETGITKITPMTRTMISLEILPVWGHEKRGAFVSSHQHINFSYALMAKEEETLKVKEDENSAVAWIDISNLATYVSEPLMLPVYEKIIKRALQL